MLPASVPDPRELARAWNAVLGRLELEVNTHNFDTWLRGTKAVRCEGNTLIVEARTEFNCDWLNQRLAVVVERAVCNVFPVELNVLFVPQGSRQEDASAPIEEPVHNATPERGQRGGSIVGNVNCSFTFDRYLAADGNRLAYESCTSLVDPVDFRVSPVVIFGTPGMGKTHLLHALACRAAADGWSVACLSAEEFSNRYMAAVRRNDVEDFHGSLRGVRLFMLDDLQYIATRQGTQNELVHTIDAVTNGGGYVVLASELHPLDLNLADRLASRLAAGIITRVEPFQMADRKLYIERLAREARVSLPTWAIERIGWCEAPSVRVLQGAVHAAVALQRANILDLRRLDAELARISVTDSSPGVLEDRALLETIARHFEVTLEQLIGRSRKAALTPARAVAVAALQERGRSLSELALVLGDRNRSTISGLGNRGRKLLEGDTDLQRRLAG
ncbi:MAG: DnaA/Hda family protein [Tepidiformaceae bacterium]